MSDNKPTWQIKQVNPAGEWLIAVAFSRDDAMGIAEALLDKSRRDGFYFNTFEVEAPDGQKRRFGE